MKIYEVLSLLKESSLLEKAEQLNEGFYAYHCTRSQIEEFNDDHTNAESGNRSILGSWNLL